MPPGGEAAQPVSANAIATAIETGRIIWNPSLLLILVSAAPRSSHACIEHAVDQLPVLEGAFPEHAFPDKSRLLQHAHGSRIPFEYRRFQALHVEALENVVRAGANRRGHDTATPAALGEPVAEA